ncbi:TRAP transporter substrate-binding protein [Stutzerimonas stutzeri]|uniref:Putative ABC transporter periplasmic solute-binding protein n=1 Tax=Stutzerimonas stutzeri (strain ATCC 17588 / DSM 5190 / CCUG 11256 / JCM 5965 / LMG 11199 / NBRC 14165 / NCIMB 11358 / Stanier 221) TaxID=96563 RepID=F8HAW6_STUS2|nr:TRAP transporter substrate-binding protein [Stutzerimonas stutzeri]AEJ05366.1 putative ABC transporter periplasmic solute-binding protein [Stutzerimonas stutzeri]QPT30353.1 TRAP transporter substrate-binding protein [Stutzerimonas stutzeri]RRV30588.1 TRAP transporter substrate-binding protein [Stutzerimonas stutzeri]
MKRLIISTLTAALLGSTLGLGQVHAADDIRPRMIRFGYGLNEDSNQGRAVKLLAEEVAKASDGKLKVRTFGSASLGSDDQMQNALIGGAQEMMVGSTATLVGITKEMAVWDTPFLFTDPGQADQVLDGPVGRQIMDKLEEKGLVGLVYWENGFRNVTNSARPIEKFEDFNGIKLRVMPNPVFIDTFKRMGANAVPLPFSELFTALETKAVDGQENPYNTILSAKFYEVQKFLSVTNHVYSPWIVTASKRWWDGLSETEQGIIMAAAQKARDAEREDTRREASQALAALKEHGMQINEVSPEEVQRMREQAQPAIQTVIDAVGQELFDQVQAEVEKAAR